MVRQYLGESTEVARQVPRLKTVRIFCEGNNALNTTSILYDLRQRIIDECQNITPVMPQTETVLTKKLLLYGSGRPTF